MEEDLAAEVINHMTSPPKRKRRDKGRLGAKTDEI